MGNRRLLRELTPAAWSIESPIPPAGDTNCLATVWRFVFVFSMRSRPFTSMMMLVVYVTAGVVSGQGPRVLCQGADGHICIEAVGNRCCDRALEPFHRHALAEARRDHSASTLTRSCDLCTDTELPGVAAHQSTVPHSKQHSDLVPIGEVLSSCPAGTVLPAQPFAAMPETVSHITDNPLRTLILRC